MEKAPKEFTMLERGTIVRHASDSWGVSGMVFKPDGSVDWYCLLPHPQEGRDPYAGMIRVAPEEVGV